VKILNLSAQHFKVREAQKTPFAKSKRPAKPEGLTALSRLSRQLRRMTGSSRFHDIPS